MSEQTTAPTADRIRLGTTNRRLDPEAVKIGAERECPLRPGLTVSILPAAMFNPRYRKALQNRVQKIADLNGGAFDEFTGHYQDPEFVADALVADMKGLRTDDGTEIAYTPELGRQVLSDPGNADVLGWISNEALDFGHFYSAQVEEDEKNS